MKSSHSLTSLLLILVFAGSTGCSSKQKLIEEDQVRSLALRYHEFCADQQRAPNDLDEFTSFNSSYSNGLSNDALEGMIQAVRDGKYVFYWNYDVRTDLQKNEKIILAHEKDTDQSKILIAYASGSVARISKEEFEATEKAGSLE